MSTITKQTVQATDLLPGMLVDDDTLTRQPGRVLRVGAVRIERTEQHPAGEVTVWWVTTVTREAVAVETFAAGDRFGVPAADVLRAELAAVEARADLARALPLADNTRAARIAHLAHLASSIERRLADADDAQLELF
jgi:hypothetical protein